MALSTYLANKLLDHVNGVASYTAPADVYVGLSTANPTPGGGSLAEPSGGSYARVLFNDWDAASGRATANTNAIVFPTASGSWGTPSYVVRFDALTSGNMLDYGAIGSPVAVSSGTTLRIPAGSADITLD